MGSRGGSLSWHVLRHSSYARFSSLSKRELSWMINKSEVIIRKARPLKTLSKANGKEEQMGGENKGSGPCLGSVSLPSSKVGNIQTKERKAAKFGDGCPISSRGRIGIGGTNGQSFRQLPAVVHPMSMKELLRKAVSGNHSVGRVICDAADDFVTSILQTSEQNNRFPTMSSIMDVDELLRGICAPVDETPPTSCRVVYGRVPEDLVGGVYIRNGPNVATIHKGERHHLFDGDGMLHAVSFKGFGSSEDSSNVQQQKLIYCSRFVQTSRFRQEKEAERPLMVKILGGMVGVGGVARAAVAILRCLLGLFDLTHGFGLSNTNICYFNGQILSLSDDDMPYIIRATEDGDLTTVARFSLPPKYSLSAHPKIDPATGDMYAFSLNFPFLPPLFPAYSFLRLPAVDDGSEPDRQFPVPLSDVPLLHDFGMTQRYIVISDHQLVIKPWKVVRSSMPMECEEAKTPRFGLMAREGPKGNAGRIWWFEAPGMNCLHIVNAWEEGEDEVVVIAPILSPPHHILDLSFSSTLSEIRLNISTRKLSTRTLLSPTQCGGNLELGVINPNYSGTRSRFVYITIGSFPHSTGIVKLDLHTHSSHGSIVAHKDFASDGLYGAEPCFVPSRNSMSEDDGYLLCLVGDIEKSSVSHLLIMDARSPSLEVVAVVELPCRVPPGFHGTFITAEQIDQQR